MGYSEALTAAGCNVLDFQEFGSYQGDWLAFVEYKGEKGIVTGCYGSCSGCDSFQAEFDYGSDNEFYTENGKFYKSFYADPEEEVTESEYNESKEKYNKRLADFGQSYLSGGLYNRAHYESLLEKLDPEDYFDQETKEQIDWVLSKTF